jgi:hypothetical protein
MMHPPEKEELLRHLRAANTYFEFGCGGSTVVASAEAPNLRRIWSVESDPAWIEKVRPQVDAARCQLIHADIGPTGGGGHPVDMFAQAPLFHRYWGAISAVGEQPDVILVDGRFRVACAVEALRVAPAATLLIHDYSIRPEYHAVEEFAEKVGAVQTLAIFRRRDGVYDSVLRVAQLKYMGDSS